jgi:uncharacterized protein (TIGR00156 family)
MFISHAALAGITSVEEALLMPGDSIVTLRGKIVEKVGYEKYLFQDDTAQIVMEIDDHKLRGLKLSEMDLVEVRGEIDNDHDGIEVDVASLRKVKST